MPDIYHLRNESLGSFSMQLLLREINTFRLLYFLFDTHTSQAYTLAQVIYARILIVTQGGSMTKKRRLTKRRLIHAAVIVGTGSFFAIVLLAIQPFYTFNQWFADQFIESEIPTSNVVIVGIDDSTLEKYGKWSEWPRSLHANAVENLSDAGATAIGYDIIFANISPQDDVFTAAIGKAGNVVLAAAGTGIPTTTEKGLSFDSYLYPTQQLNQASGYLGHVDMIPDADGKVRRIPLVIQGEDGTHIPTLGLAVMYALFHQSLPESYQILNGTIDALARNIPVDNTYYMRLNFAIQSGGIPVISYGDIVSGNFDPNAVKNKIVLVGMTATGDIDTFAIPNSSIRVPGVMLHAATIDTILRSSFLAETGIGVTLFNNRLDSCDLRNSPTVVRHMVLDRYCERDRTYNRPSAAISGDQFSFSEPWVYYQCSISRPYSCYHLGW